MREGGGGAAGNSRVGQSVGPSVGLDFINLNFEKFAEREAGWEKRKEEECKGSPFVIWTIA